MNYSTLIDMQQDGWEPCLSDCEADLLQKHLKLWEMGIFVIYMDTLQIETIG
jgi:hypothetical protein